MEILDIKQIAGFDRVLGVITRACENRTLSKAVLSRPRDKSAIRAVATLFEKGGRLLIALEAFMRDGKAIRKNFPADGEELAASAEMLAILALRDYRQVNIVCADLICEALISDKYKLHVTEKKQELREITVAKHDKVKARLLREGEL